MSEDGETRIVGRSWDKPLKITNELLQQSRPEGHPEAKPERLFDVYLAEEPTQEKVDKFYGEFDQDVSEVLSVTRNGVPLVRVFRHPREPLQLAHIQHVLSALRRSSIRASYVLIPCGHDEI